MKIGIIGYGKMGKTIEKIAQERGHEVPVIIDQTDTLDKLKAVDVAIEFSQPESAFKNITYCLKNNIKVISGTTGWLDKYEEALALCQANDGTFLYASNFSISVNLFFELNQWLAQRMGTLDYGLELEEIHHTEKKDAPSGTAITLAEGIMGKIARYENWKNDKTTDKNIIPILSKRIKDVPGTHTVSYSTPLETISITHEALDRKIFAEGAVQVAEWIADKKGVWQISDFIKQI